MTTLVISHGGEPGEIGKKIGRNTTPEQAISASAETLRGGERSAESATRCEHGVWKSDHCWTCEPNPLFGKASRPASVYVEAQPSSTDARLPDGSRITHRWSGPYHDRLEYLLDGRALTLEEVKGMLHFAAVTSAVSARERIK
jgi:hypothetical protein